MIRFQDGQDRIEMPRLNINDGFRNIRPSSEISKTEARDFWDNLFEDLAKRFKRILYLVDRNALGNQTMDTFKDVRLEDLKSLNKLYDIKGLKEKDFEKDTRVQIATVQSLVKRILYNDSNSRLGVSDYDLIIVDEAHRGYILDKDIGEDEILYRNQDEFRSKYRAVIDYFDAVKIALTATPALHTTEIFGKPVIPMIMRLLS